jgi:Holliday junction resolvase
MKVSHRGRRVKGARFENEVVDALQGHGIAAERVPLSGAVKGGSFEGDVLCPVQGQDWKLECKRKARAFTTLYRFIGGNNAVVVRDDHTKPLVVMTLETFARLARGQPANDGPWKTLGSITGSLLTKLEKERV